VGEGKVIRRAIETDDRVSMIFWSAPGMRKTTLAQIIAQESKSDFKTFDKENEQNPPLPILR
ncbi:MAG: hypothetical protein ACE5JB_14260, partial [bacterium]